MVSDCVFLTRAMLHTYTHTTPLSYEITLGRVLVWHTYNFCIYYHFHCCPSGRYWFVFVSFKYRQECEHENKHNLERTGPLVSVEENGSMLNIIQLNSWPSSTTNEMLCRNVTFCAWMGMLAALLVRQWVRKEI